MSLQVQYSTVQYSTVQYSTLHPLVYYSCEGWPYKRCSVTMGRSRGQCQPPYESRRNKCLFSRFPKKVSTPSVYLQSKIIFKMFNFRCSILKECERCDDYCAKKDGKRDRRAYTDRRGCGDPIDIDNLGTMTAG